ncbi:MAG TPA: fumarate reductase/succinate dehydrogenase flavoprotein subunit, partial [bacterium]|nr:fumarate reductase/succinate dehydrogenase flavoprotein subunit [bacterium]
MGGLWVDYNLMSNVPGLFVLGEANFSDHGANRLGASALMQGLADGYFVLPYTIGNYLTGIEQKLPSIDHQDFVDAELLARDQSKKLLSINGTRTVESFHRDLGKIMWEKCGMGRNEKGLKEALVDIPKLKEDFWKNVRVLGTNEELNYSLEKAGRVADYLDFAQLMCLDALTRDESCGGHFREEHQTKEGEALRNDRSFAHVSVWEHVADNKQPVLHKEPLVFEEIKLAERNYK